MIRPSPLSPERRARSGGFSLIEMMIVITVIGFMAATILPTIGTMLAENRQHRAGLEVMLAARRARVEAMFSGYASALHFVQQPDGAVITPVTGITTRCSRGDNGNYGTTLPGWQQLPGSPVLLMSRYDMAGQSVRARLSFNNADVNTGFLCWEPRGECWYSATPWNAAAVNPQTVMFFERFDLNDQPAGTARQLVFPASCTARLR